MGWTDGWDSTATSTLPAGLKFSLVMAAKDNPQAVTDPIELIVPVLVVTTTSQQEAAEEAAP
jgi:hypothetical protein